MSLICVLYACMICRLLRRHGAVGGGTGGQRATYGSGSSETARARRRVTRLVVVVVAVFGACWLPIHIVFIVQYFHTANDESMITHTFIVIRLAANCLAYANSCLNPILYAFLSDNFRSGLVRLCCRGDVRHRNAATEHRGRRDRELTREQPDGAGGAGARPLLAVVEDRVRAANEPTKEEGCVSTALQIPAYGRTNTRRLTETTAMAETVL